MTALTEVATTSPGQFDHTAQRLRDARVLAAARAQVTDQLTAAGIPVVEQPAFGQRGDLIRIDRLRSAASEGDEPVPLTPEEHAGCPGHAAHLSDHYPFRGPVEIRPVHVCTDWRRYGHQELVPDTITGLRAGGRMSEEQKTERRQVVANNKAWAAAEKVRRRWLREFLTRRTAPKDAPQWIAATLASSTHEVRRALENGHSTALTLLDLTDPAQHKLGWTPYSGTPHPAVTAATAATPARATVITLGLLLGGLESTITRNAWRQPSTAHRSYLTALQTWGYTLSEVEQLVLTPAGTSTQDGSEGSTEGSTEDSTGGEGDGDPDGDRDTDRGDVGNPDAGDIRRQSGGALGEDPAGEPGEVEHPPGDGDPGRQRPGPGPGCRGARQPERAGRVASRRGRPVTSGRPRAPSLLTKETLMPQYPPPARPVDIHGDDQRADEHRLHEHRPDRRHDPGSAARTGPPRPLLRAALAAAGRYSP